MSYHSYLKNTIIGCLTVIIDKEKVINFCDQNNLFLSTVEKID